MIKTRERSDEGHRVKHGQNLQEILSVKVSAGNGNSSSRSRGMRSMRRVTSAAGGMRRMIPELRQRSG